MHVPDGNKPIKIGDPSFIYKGVYHPIVWFGTDPYRPRVETLIIKDHNQVYAYIHDLNHRETIEGSPSNKRNHFYSIPGGSIDADSTMIEQAEAETNEEALISIKGIYPTGIEYYEQYDKGFLLKGGDMPIEYVGSISYIFVALYNGPYDKSKVEEKDLDPDMADRGKFHPIADIKEYLRQEHVQALLKSPYVDTKTKTQLLLHANFIVGESVDPSKMDRAPSKIYHGSTYKIETFKPMSLDLGNAFQKPGWSTFCFLDKNHAELFGAMRALQQLLQSSSITSNKRLQKELTVEILDEQLVISNDCLDLIKGTDLVNTQVTYYVYTIDASNLDVCIGNDPCLPEVTFREDGITPIKTDCFKTSIMELREAIGLLNDSITNIEQYRTQKNGYAEYQTHNYRTEAVRKDLEKAVRDKELQPGDDVEEYMVAHDLSFESEDIHLPDMVLEIDEPVMESSFTPILEETYPLECYGLPRRKGYPMPDKQHVLSAIRFFNYADASEEKELARNINKQIEKFRMTDIKVGPNNRFRKYYKPKKKGSSGKKLKKGSKPKKTATITEATKKSTQTMQLRQFSKLTGKANILKEEYPALLSCFSAPTVIHLPDTANVVIWINPKTELPIGFIATEQKPDGVWITAIELSKKYQNTGLSKQMIDVAVKEYGATKLSVAKSNKVAYDIYTQSFTVYDETDRTYFMKIVDEAYAAVDRLFHPVLEAGKDDDDDTDTDEETSKKGEEEGEEDTDMDEPAEEYANDVEDGEGGNDDDTDTEPESPEDDEATTEEPEGEEDTDMDEPAEEYANDVEEEPPETPDDTEETDPDTEDEATADTSTEDTPEEPDTEDTSDVTADTADAATTANMDTETPSDDTIGEEEPLGGEPTDYSGDVSGDTKPSEDMGTDTEDGDTEDSSDTEDNTDDTTDEDISESENTEEDDKNKKRFDNRELKNYFLLNDFLSVRELITDISESANGLILQTPEANQALAKVIKTLQDIQTFIENFIQFQFSDTDYKFNLYYYNLTVTTLKMNLETLQKIVHLEENK